MTNSLEARVALVTGASRGIGLAIARTLSEQGARVVMTARRRSPLLKAQRQVAGRTEAAAADVTNPADVSRLFRYIAAHHARLDILINNAGVFTYKLFEATTFADWRQNIESNLTSLFLTTRAALPLLKKSESPQIVNILSISSRIAYPKCSAYTAAKFGALGFTRVLREELREQRIRVTAILPGPTNTRMADEFDVRVRRREILQPQDVADAVVAALAQPDRAMVEEILIRPAAFRVEL